MDQRADVLPELSWKILASAIEVHRALGPGLLENAYKACLAHQLRADGLAVRSEVPIPVEYKGALLDVSYRADLIVENSVLLELKAVEALVPLHTVQLLTYLKLTGLPLGLLINFNVPRLKDGVRRFVNRTPDSQRPGLRALAP